MAKGFRFMGKMVEPIEKYYKVGRPKCKMKKKTAKRWLTRNHHRLISGNASPSDHRRADLCAKILNIPTRMEE